MIRCLVVFLLPFYLWALPFGNPAQPALLKEGFFLDNPPFTAKVGFREDFIFDQKLKGNKDQVGSVYNFSRLDELGLLSFNLFHRVELTACCGASLIKFSDKPANDGKLRTYQTSNELALGGGLQGILYRKNHLFISANVQGFWVKSHLRYFTVNGQGFAFSSPLKLTEWQAGIGISYKIDFFIPYLAVSYSTMDIHLRSLSPSLGIATSHFSMHTKLPLLISLGTSLTKGKRFDFNIECQLLTQSGITLAGMIAF